MSGTIYKAKQRKQALKKIIELEQQSKYAYIIHYSCESFYDCQDGRTPRITSIAVRNLASGQTQSFSIHKIAEENNIKFEKIDEYYDSLEKIMLDSFFEFLKINQNYMWIHWNMRDINYGFAALEHRYKVLSGEPHVVAEDKKIDLARKLIEIYGENYTEHRRSETILFKNNISKLDYLTGDEEGQAFKDKEYVKLHPLLCERLIYFHQFSKKYYMMN